MNRYYCKMRAIFSVAMAAFTSIKLNYTDNHELC